QTLQLDLPADAERGLFEGEPHDHPDVLSSAGSGARSATPRAEPPEPSLPEEHLEDVGDVGERLAARAGRAERVVARALLGIGQDLVRARDLLEPLLGLGIRAYVGVELAGEPSVGLADVLVGGITGNPKHVVEVACDGHLY